MNRKEGKICNLPKYERKENFACKVNWNLFYSHLLFKTKTFLCRRMKFFLKVVKNIMPHENCREEESNKF
jgi:hypothetical protein